MTTLSQTLANQANAARSTGPRTAEGKAASRRNALKHGLAAEKLVLPGEEAEVVAARIAAWSSALHPRDDYDGWLVEQVVVGSVQIERCQAHEISLRTRQAARAGLCWDEDRQADAADLGARLAKAPETVACQLRDTKQGCDWLIGRWEGLGRLLQAKGDWDAPQRRLALDLLGTPAELRDGPTPLDGDLGTREALIREQVGRLHALQAAALGELDDLERSAAELGLGGVGVTDKAIALSRRYEAACLRRMLWARNQIGKKAHISNPPENREPGRSDAARDLAHDAADLARLQNALRAQDGPEPRELTPAPAPAQTFAAVAGTRPAPPVAENRKARRARKAHARRS